MLLGSMIDFQVFFLPRRSWSYSKNHVTMANTRKRVNGGLRYYMLKHCAYFVTHPYFNDVHTALSKDDCVHL